MRRVFRRSIAPIPFYLSVVIFSGCGGGGGADDSKIISLPITPLSTTADENPTSDMVIQTPETVSSSPSHQSEGGLAQASDGKENVFRDVTERSGLNFKFGFSSPMQNNEVPWIFPSGVAAGDYDNDGDIDLLIVRGDTGPNLLYRNLGDLVFDEVGADSGIAFTRSDSRNWRHGSPAFADMDGDGHLDIFFAGLDGDPNKIYKNMGDGTFSDVSRGSGIDQMRAAYTSSPTFGDYDLDGDLDMALGHWGTPRDYSSAPNETEHLWRNDSSVSKIVFTPVTYVSGISPGILTIADSRITQRAFDNTFTPTFADINADGYPDLLMAADFNFSQVFINNQDGTFRNSTDTRVIVDGNGMGSAVGDYDGDGDLDWFVSSVQTEGNAPSHLSRLGNRLYRNNQYGVFDDSSGAARVSSGGWGWGSCFIDYDNDTDLDIYQTNGWPEWAEFGDFPSDVTRTFINQGNGTFIEGAASLGLDDMEQGRGIVCADFDRDGDVDILQLHGNSKNAVTLWENQNGGNYLTVALNGRVPNTQSIGARIIIESGGKWQLREVILGNNFASHNPVEQYFGLGDSDHITTLRITWPDGSETELRDLQANQYLEIRQDAAETSSRLVVNRGSGSGFYQPGEQVMIAASGVSDEHYNFSHWTTNFDGLISDYFAEETVLTIPQSLETITIEANYLPGPKITESHSVARRWNEVLLQAIRNDFARPTVHARNLFHISSAVYDSWSAYDEVAIPWLLGNTRAGEVCEFSGSLRSEDDEEREEAASYAAYRLILHRFSQSPGSDITTRDAKTLMGALGYDVSDLSKDSNGVTPSSLGNHIADCYIRFGLADGANEAEDYSNEHYSPVNPPLNPELPGNSGLNDFNRWQPLRLSEFIDQSGNPIEQQPAFFGPEWGSVYPFALRQRDLNIFQRSGSDYWVYHDPGGPPTLGGSMSDFYKWGYSLVTIWSSHLDPKIGKTIDISPASIGNVDSFPDSFEDYQKFYNLFDGGDIGSGYEINPVTAEPYDEQLVPLGDYARVLAEFWADGPDSETPPGHWFVIFNTVMDHPNLERRFEGVGDLISKLEWDVKGYFALGGAMHDSAIAAWGAKGWYDSIRPISALRAMGELGQGSDMSLVSYNPKGIPLHRDHIDIVGESDDLAGESGEHVGKIKYKAWRGPSYIKDVSTDLAGVGWILAENWWPYQRPSFVTPPFAGYVSGHSTYSRAAAEVLTAMTGSAFFPQGMSGFEVKRDEFLVFENGPSVDMTLQWASYRDAADQCGLSRIWGGIHPPQDDIPGRKLGIQVGMAAFLESQQYFRGLTAE